MMEPKLQRPAQQGHNGRKNLSAHSTNRGGTNKEVVEVEMYKEVVADHFHGESPKGK